MKKMIGVLLLLPICLCKAQTGARVLNFNKGDAFEKKTIITSSCRLRQGGQAMNVTSSSVVTKLYTVNNVLNNGFQFNVTTSQVTDTINGMGQQFIYHADGPVDTGSVIQTAIRNIVNIPVSVVVNNRGIITSGGNVPAQQGSDIIMSYSGLQPVQYNKGDELDLAAGFVYNPLFTKGFSWTDSSTANGNKTIVTYTIQSIGDGVTGVSFEGTVIENNFTTNITGVLMVDNATGIINQKMQQTASTGYNVLNGVAYTEERRTSLSEYCIKKQ